MASAGGGAGHGPVSQEDVAHLQAIAGCSEDQARFLLEAAGGNMDMAVHMFLGKQHDLGISLNPCWGYDMRA